jgi:SAM-dependent methyltransferase
MLKYMMYVNAARIFSFSPQTLRLYRFLGNIMLERRRIQEGLPSIYIQRSRLLHEICQRYPVAPAGAKVLEVGTGWVHWEGMIIRLLYDAELTLFDVWDNRLWKTFRQYLEQFDKVVDRELQLSPAQSERVHQLLCKILQADSFTAVYQLLDAKYIINPNGTLDQFEDGSFNAVISSDVLEHVDRHILPGFIQDFYRVIKPNGYMVHQIDIADHFAYFVPTASRKQYYEYSDRTWERQFENKVQYFNRVQRPEWLTLFRGAGFELVEENLLSETISTTKIDDKYKNLSQQDLECMVMRVVYRKPG